MPNGHPSSDLGLTGINVPAAQPTIYADFPLEPGFHLRWQLRQGLGLPERFLIYRTNRRFFDRIYTSDFDGGHKLTQEAEAMGEAGLLALLQADINSLNELGQPTLFTTPVFALEYNSWNAMKWLTDAPHRGIDPLLPFPPSPYSNALQETYASSDAVTELQNMIYNLRNTLEGGQQIGMHIIYAMHQQVIEQEPEKSFRTSLKRMDALNLAALDPHFARMAGFYFIDRQPPFQEVESSRVGYFVIADYGSQQYPFTIVVPKREVVLFEIASEMRFEGFKAVAMGGSYLHFSATDAHNLGFLTTFSGLNPAIRFVFDEPNGIEEAIIIVQTTGSITSDFFVAADGWHGHDGISVEEQSENDTLQVRAGQPSGGMRTPFRRLDVKGNGAGSLIIKEVRFKYKIGRIGLFKSNPIILGDGVGEEKIQPLLLGKALSEPMAPVLNEDGVYDPFRSNLKLSLIHKTRPVDEAHPNIIASNSPVRVIFRGTPTISQEQPEISIIRRPKRVLPELVFYAPLTFVAKDYATGQPLSLFGSCRFVKDHPSDKKYNSLLLTADGGAYAAESRALWSSQTFTISLRLKIGVGTPANEYIPLVNFGGEQGVSLGFQHANGSLFWRLNIGVHTSESPPVILYLNTWWGINASFDNGRVVFNYADGARMDVPPVPLIGTGIAIGMDFNSITNQITGPFKGQICDVRIWNKVISSYQADYLLREHAGDFPQQLLPTSFFSLPGPVFFIPDAILSLQKVNIPILNTLNAGFSCHFWLNVNNDDGAVFFSDASGEFLCGVDYSSQGRMFLKYNNFFYYSNSVPQKGTQVHIGIAYDADLNILRFYIDANLDREVPAGNIPFSAIRQPICFGGEPDGNWILSGGMADICFYPYAVAPSEVTQDFATYQLLETNIPDGNYDLHAIGIDLFGRISPPSHLMQHQVQSNYRPNPPASLKAEVLTFETLVQSATLSTPTDSEEKPVWNVHLQTVPSFDLNSLRRHIVTISGLKQATISLENKEIDPIPKLIRQKYEVKDQTITNNILPLQDVAFAQIKPGETSPQTVLIEYNARVNLRWEWTGLQQIFNPGVTRFQAFYRSGLLNDWQGKVTAVVAGSTNRQFRVQADLAVPGEANELAGKICLIDHRAYVIVSHSNAGQAAEFELRYDGYPILVPEIGGIFMLTLPETHSAWLDFNQLDHWQGVQAAPEVSVDTRLPNPILIHTSRYRATSLQLHHADVKALKENKNIDWLPADLTWRMRLTPTDANVPRPANYVELEPDKYVTSALVVECKTDNLYKGIWNAWYVLWHEWTEEYLDFYITVADQNQQPNVNNQELPDSAYPVVPPTELLRPISQIFFYPGQAFTQKVVIRPPGDGESPLLSYHFAVASMASTISPLSVKTSVVAVDRRLPEEPEAPTIESIGLADVHGNSLAHLSWKYADSVYGYNLYRATDTAIFERDLENRRLKLGFYEETHIATGDADFSQFLSAVQHKDAAVFAPGFAAEVAFNKSLSLLEEADLYGRDKEKYGPKWNALTPIWQYWADRFYPALDDSEKEDIANRPGNETAFTLVNTEPIRKDIYADPERRDTHIKYSDTVNGVVSNQYFYRLRTVAPNMALGSTWSRVSNGMGVSIPAARPRTPVWTKVEAGDRQVTLQWALNREPDFKEYILYRATNKDLLDNVRWAEVEPQAGLVVRRIGDPRILTSLDTNNGNSIIVFPEGQTPPPIAAIVGIYRAFEFDNKVVGEQLGAMNLVQSSMQVTGNSIRGIKKVAYNTEVVIVWRNADGVAEVMMAFGEWPMVDRTVVPLTEYQYKISSGNTASVFSEESKVVFAKALNEYSPNPPRWISPVLQGRNVILSWETTNPNIRCLIQRRLDFFPEWENLSGWLNRGQNSFLDDSRETGRTYVYRIRIMDENGKINYVFSEITF